MKHSLIITLAMMVLICSCQTNEKQNETPDRLYELKDLPESLAGIEEIVMDIEAKQDDLEERGPISITRGDDNWEIYAYYIDQSPALLRAIYSGGEQVYFFFDRRIVRLHEFANLENGNIEERVFSYTENDIVEAKARVAESRGALQDIPFSAYKSSYGDADFRLHVNQVNGSATSFIYGQ